MVNPLFLCPWTRKYSVLSHICFTNSPNIMDMMGHQDKLKLSTSSITGHVPLTRRSTSSCGTHLAIPTGTRLCGVPCPAGTRGTTSGAGATGTSAALLCHTAECSARACAHAGWIRDSCFTRRVAAVWVLLACRVTRSVLSWNQLICGTYVVFVCVCNVHMYGEGSIVALLQSPIFFALPI